jgi:RNA polymerase sigma-70 factor (ECF subfamily)
LDKACLDELLRQARQRNPDALSRLVAEYSPRVYGLLYRLTGTPEAAEDLLQETFLRVVRTIEEYEHDGKFEQWLFRIAANLARDRARQLKRRGPQRALDDESGAAATQGLAAASVPAQPAEMLLRREEGERLAAALARLTAPEREILLLRHFAELSFKEIAELLEVPLGTALARAHRALQRLKEELGPARGA